MIRLKCDCCGYSEEFESSRESFDKGWDFPPFFTGYMACDLCPAVFAIGFAEPTKEHLDAHAKWSEIGRPG